MEMTRGQPLRITDLFFFRRFYVVVSLLRMRKEDNMAAFQPCLSFDSLCFIDQFILNSL